MGGGATAPPMGRALEWGEGAIAPPFGRALRWGRGARSPPLGRALGWGGVQFIFFYLNKISLLVLCIQGYHHVYPLKDKV